MGVDVARRREVLATLKREIECWDGGCGGGCWEKEREGGTGGEGERGVGVWG